jgi:hypothetical protein
MRNYKLHNKNTAKNTVKKTILYKKTHRITVKQTKQSKYNYYSATEFFPQKYIDEQFEKRGNWNRVSKSQLLLGNPKLHFIYINGKYLFDKLYYGIKSEIGSIIDDERKRVIQKHNLTEYLNKHSQGHKYIMKSYIINAAQVLKSPNMLTKYKNLFSNKSKQFIYILKPVSGYSGANTYIIKTFNELRQNMKSIVHTAKWARQWEKGSDFYKEWVLQEYLDDPLLYNNPVDAQKYKFHIRHYFIFRPYPEKSFFLRKGLIATGLKPYLQSDYSNKDIHDTHFHGRDGEHFPNDLHLTQNILIDIYKQIAELYDIINKYLQKYANCYPEYTQCFSIFGADLMLTRDYKIKILELNGSPGFADEHCTNILPEYRNIIENVLSIIVDSKFPPARIPINTYLSDVVYLP